MHEEIPAAHAISNVMTHARLRGASLASIALAMAVAFIVISGTAANAEPGQTLASFRGWAANEPLLRGLLRSKDELSGMPAYGLTNADHGIAWTFHASTNGERVTSEMLSVGSNGTDTGEPIRHDGTGYGFAFWSRLYGQTIAHDFRTSRAIYHDRNDGATTTYYRGARFGYVVSNGTVTIETHTSFDRNVADTKACDAKPSDCSE